MKRIKILSKRDYETWPSWHLVFEWEEDIAKVLNVPIVSSKKRDDFFTSKIVSKLLSYRYGEWLAKKINKVIADRQIFIAFELFTNRSLSYTGLKNTVPIIIDYWESKNFERFYQVYANCALVCISNLELYTLLINNNCPLNIKHLPLSLPGRYALDAETIFEKKYDFLFAGRRNEPLWQYMQMFEKKHPDIEYLYQDSIDGTLIYKNNKGISIGEFHSREDYFRLLKSSRIAFYSTPGIDGGELRTDGLNPVTPRYLELLAAGCFVMGRYPDNADTLYFKLHDFCPNITCYNDFEETALRYLSLKQPDLKKYAHFLESHYTSNTAHQLQEYIRDAFKEG